MAVSHSSPSSGPRRVWTEQRGPDGPMAFRNAPTPLSIPSASPSEHTFFLGRFGVMFLVS